MQNNIFILSDDYNGNINCYLVNSFNGKKQLVGSFNKSKRELNKKASLSLHYMHKFNSFGLQKSLVDNLRILKCKKINISEIEKRNIWSVSYDIFMAKSFMHEFPKYGEQMFLDKKWWDILDSNDKFIQHGQIPKPEKEQLGLFENRRLF